MNVREDSKKIVRFYLEKAIDCGKLDKRFPVSMKELVDVLGMEQGKDSERYCRICCQYLNGGRYVDYGYMGEDFEEILLNSAAVDLLFG